VIRNNISGPSVSTPNKNSVIGIFVLSQIPGDTVGLFGFVLPRIQKSSSFQTAHPSTGSPSDTLFRVSISCSKHKNTKNVSPISANYLQVNEPQTQKPVNNEIPEITCPDTILDPRSVVECGVQHRFCIGFTTRPVLPKAASALRFATVSVQDLAELARTQFRF
jgi:hypothetical protein